MRSALRIWPPGFSAGTRGARLLMLCFSDPSAFCPGAPGVNAMVV